MRQRHCGPEEKRFARYLHFQTGNSDMTDAATERASLERQRVDLTAKRQKLLEAHYAGAIPMDLLKSEQDKLSSQLASVQHQLTSADDQFETARTSLADTLDLTRDCYAAYLEANETTRRLFNQAFFTHIYIDEDDLTRERTVRVDYNQPFDELLARLVPARVHQDLTEADRQQKQNARQANQAGIRPTTGDAEGQGSHTDALVEPRGLEPLTPCLQSRCAASCAMAPIVGRG